MLLIKVMKCCSLDMTPVSINLGAPDKQGRGDDRAGGTDGEVGGGKAKGVCVGDGIGIVGKKKAEGSDSGGWLRRRWCWEMRSGGWR